MILLGILVGLSDIAWTQSFAQFISDLFIRIFRCISLPIIALSVIVTLTTYHSQKKTQRLWKKTITYTLGTTIVASIVSCLLYVMIQPNNVLSAHTDHTPILDKVNSPKGYWGFIQDLVPTNIFSPFIEHQVMGVLVVGILIGCAIRSIPDSEARQTITHFFQGAHSIFIVVTKWIVKVIPLGLFGFIAVTIMQLRQGLDISSLAKYLSVVVLANVIQGFIILPLWLRSNNISPFKTMAGMMPALSLAFFSKSSAGTLPVTMNCAENNLKVDSHTARFVLPLCTSINMNGCAAFIFATVIYLMQNHGIEITPMTMVAWVFMSTIAAVGNAGVPMGCFFLSASLLASMDVPINLLGIILPFYTIIDMIETSLNVWSDSCVAVMVDQQTKQPAMMEVVKKA